MCWEEGVKGKSSYSVIPPESQWSTDNAGIQTDIHESGQCFSSPNSKSPVCMRVCVAEQGRGVDTQHNMKVLLQNDSFWMWTGMSWKCLFPLYSIMFSPTVSLTEIGKAKRLPQNYFVSIRDEHNVVIHDKEALYNKVLML